MSATTPVPSEEQLQRAKWDLLLLDIEQRSEQLRQLKATPTRIVVLQLVVSAATAAVVVIGGVAGGIIWLLHALGRLQ